ncbi:hypothetical protein L249_1800 [Ophiocordyceps polyrhachis-furcata BCC 54312]|uniref:Uncharacterized protein n=1 Tax=Ophiocordyceps polyrhachis-furcata BCC 54312 TaxID=1330021 RepID=A0A367LRM1_9HYPO|nr:hypothetical protein L249_1800 [Ophiocordyceps polyrhachis-furcata BCC 54312]
MKKWIIAPPPCHVAHQTGEDGGETLPGQEGCRRAFIAGVRLGQWLGFGFAMEHMGKEKGAMTWKAFYRQLIPHSVQSSPVFSRPGLGPVSLMAKIHPSIHTTWASGEMETEGREGRGGEGEIERLGYMSLDPFPRYSFNRGCKFQVLIVIPHLTIEHVAKRQRQSVYNLFAPFINIIVIFFFFLVATLH